MKRSGFTLIELLVIISVIVTIIAVALPNYPAIKQQLALSRAAHQVAQDIKRAQELSLAAAQLTEAEGSCSLALQFASLGNPLPLVPTSSQAKGYGIYINLSEDNKAYRLYADTAADTGADCSTYPPTPCWKYYNSSDCIFKTIFLQESGIVIKEINNNLGNAQKTSINFSPPNPDTTIKWLLSGSSGVDIVIAVEADLSKTKTVTVNRSGLIEVR